MWVISEIGFFSIVETADGQLQFRSRSRRDLERLRLLVGEGRILRTPQADYPYRMILPKEVGRDVLGQLAADVSYPNFKARIGESDPRRAAVYAEVWFVLRALEARGR